MNSHTQFPLVLEHRCVLPPCRAVPPACLLFFLSLFLFPLYLRPSHTHIGPVCRCCFVLPVPSAVRAANGIPFWHPAVRIRATAMSRLLLTAATAQPSIGADRSPITFSLHLPLMRQKTLQKRQKGSRNNEHILISFFFLGCPNAFPARVQLTQPMEIY